MSTSSPPISAPATYTVPDLAGLLRISERHAWRLVGRDAVPGVIRFGRVVRFARAAVDDWIARGCTSRREGGSLVPAESREVPCGDA